MPLLNDGRLGGLAVTSAMRSKFVPDPPTVSEAGVPGYAYDAWWAMFAPAQTPNGVVNKLRRAIARVLDTPEMKAHLNALGAEPGGNTPEDFALQMKREYGQWQELFNKVNIKIQ